MDRQSDIIQTRQRLLDRADAAFDGKEFAEALRLYREALLLVPDDIEALTGEALSVMHQGNHAEAIPLFQALLPRMPDSEPLLFMLAESLYRSGRIDEARGYLLRLVSQNPRHADAWNRLGSIQMQSGEFPEARDSFSQALAADPQHVEALCNAGLLLFKFCSFDQAEQMFRRALRVDPENLLAINNMGRCCKMQGRLDEALDWYRKGLALDESAGYLINNYLFALCYADNIDPIAASAEHKRLARHFTPKEGRHEIKPVSPAGRKLRIGYISGDLYTHSVSYFLEPVLIHHDYSKFEVFCYSTGANKDATTERLMQLPCFWRDMTALPPQAIAEKVQKDRIDILVDLSGHTSDSRLELFAARSAPVQVSWIGYPATTGLVEMDYYLSDSLCDLPGMTDHLFSETVWRLPRIFSCYLPPLEFPQVVEPPFIRNGYITFGSFNNFAKVTRRQLELWAEILKKVPGSRLYLKSMPLGERTVTDAVQNLFAAQGIERDRIRQRVVTRTPLEHLAEYSNIDIALDTYPYHGTTTTCEALWMGVPVLTREGVAHASRVGVSLLTAVGCPELVAQDEREYVEKAVQLASSPQRLCWYRENLRGMMAVSPLMDAQGVTREVEAAFTAMFAAACRKAGVPL